MDCAHLLLCPLSSRHPGRPLSSPRQGRCIMAVPLPDRATLDAAQRRAEEERAFWDVHRAELTQQYPDEFVAVRSSEVIDHDRDLMVLASRLQAKDIDP